MRTELYWVPGPWPGRLAIMPRPRGGDWLEDEIRSWRAAGADVVVSALEAAEVEELDLAGEPALSETNGVVFLTFPIPDRGVPASSSGAKALVGELEAKLKQGETVAIHCRQGVGRASLLAASLLAVGGVAVDEAFSRIQKARGRPVPDTEEQRKWVQRFAQDTLVAREAG